MAIVLTLGLCLFVGRYIQLICEDEKNDKSKKV